MALALFLTHHSFKILSLTHICLHLLAYFFSFHFFILFSHFKNWNFAFTNTQLALYKAFTCHFVHALVIICERVCDYESVRVFLPPIDLTTTPKFFNNKEKGDRIRDQKIIIHIPSHLKHTHTLIYKHTRTNIYKIL